MLSAQEPASPDGQPVWERFRQPVLGAPADLQLYVVPLTAVADWMKQSPAGLDETAQDQAEKSTDPQARSMRLASAPVLHALLSRRLGIHSEDLVIRRRPRPHLDPPQGNLQFSLSRGADTIVVATAERAVGVDIEQRQNRHETRALMQVIHPVERRRLQMLPNPLRTRATTSAWTRKEAVLKAWGVGLSRDPALDFTGIAGRRTVRSTGFDPVTVSTVVSGRFSLAVAWAVHPSEF